MERVKKIKKHGKHFLGSINETRKIQWLILLATTVLLTVLLFPSIWEASHEYHVGDVAEKDIKSPKDFLIEDKRATREKQEEAATSVPTVYDLDDTLVTALETKTVKAFEHLRAVFTKYEAIAENQKNSVVAPKQDAPSAVEVQPPISLEEAVWKEREAFEDLLGLSISKDAYGILEKQKFSMEIPEAISNLVRPIFDIGIVGNKQLLLREQEKGIVVRKLSSKEESLVRDLRAYQNLDSAKVSIKTTGKKLLKPFNYSVRNIIIDLSQRSIQPNLTLNKGETEERKKSVVENVKAVLAQIKKGEMLVREGEKVTPLHMAKLMALESEMKDKPMFTISTGFILLILTFFVTAYIVYFNTDTCPKLKNKDLVFLCTMLVFLFFLSQISTYLVKGIATNIPHSVETSSAYFSIPVAAGAMTVCLVNGIAVAIPFAISAACVTSFLFEDPFHMVFFLFLSGIAGAYSVRNCRERGVLIKAGLNVSLLNVVIITALHMFKGGGVELKLIWTWAFGILGGISSGILTTGLAPVVEMIFSYTTDIKLLELANLDRPILRKLMLEAPGTYHHSVIVGNLVEAAAANISANPLLSKVGGYYHDIGKIKKPLYFIENQLPGRNRHDKLAPSMSSLILASHVKDGVETAKRHKLGATIVDIIQQHHGTSVITFFYEKAKRLKGEHAVNLEHFRYGGPRPQTREAGLVLLADVVEASSRTLDNPTPARIKGQVKKVIDDTLLAGQLDECELTLKDLNKIGESFNKTLNAIYHHRIDYPKGNGVVKMERSPTSVAG